MSRALIVVRSDVDRARAAKWAQKAPVGTRIEYKLTRRSTAMNAKMWSMLTELSTQLVWYGKKLRAEDWKLIMLDGLKRELRVVPNIDGTGFVNLGRSSSDLTRAEMSDLFELISAFGAERGVVFGDQSEEQSNAQ